MPSNSLEQQAMDRVARMYSSFDRRPQRPAPERPAPKPGDSRREEPSHEKPQPADEAPAVVQKPPQPDKRGFLELLMKDKDQSLIMLLLVILMKDGADMNLMLALVYMLL